MKRSIKNFFYNASYHILVAIIPLVTTPYISRVLRSEGVGVYSYTGAFANFFAILAAMGVNAYGQREIAKVRDSFYLRSKIFTELCMIRLFTSVICLIIYIPSCCFWGEYRQFFLFQGIVLISVVFDIAWLFQGLELFKLVVIKNSIVKLLGVILVFALVKKENDISMYILINVVSVLAGNIVLFFECRKYVTIIPLKELNLVQHIKPNFEFFLPVIAVQMYTHLDKIMLARISGDIEENGFYEQARKIVDILTRFIVSVNTVLFPKVSYCYAKEKKEQLQKIYVMAFKIILAITLPIAVGLFILADGFVVWFFGEEFIKTSMLLKTSAIMLVFMCIGNYAGVLYLMPSGKQNQATAIYFISAVLNIALNIILIPKLLSMGAIIASLVSEVLSCTLQMFLFMRQFRDIKISRGWWKYAIASFGMGILLITLGLSEFDGGIGFIFSTFVGMIGYMFLLYVLREEIIVHFIILVKEKAFGKKI